MTLALEALENVISYGSLTGDDFVFDQVDEATTSLRQAIAHPQPKLETKNEPVPWEQFHEHMAGPFYVAPQRTWVGLTELDCVGWFGYDTGLRLWFEADKNDDGAIPLYKNALEMANRALETKDATVQVSPLEFVEMVMEKEHLIGQPIFWAQWPNKEKNT